MTNATDLLWWDDGTNRCKLTAGGYRFGVYLSKKFGKWVWFMEGQIVDACESQEEEHCPTRQAAMQAAVDAAESAGVDFSKAPR